TEVYVQDLAFNNTTGVDYSVTVNVSVGSTVDFAIDPKSNEAFDSTTFTAHVVSVGPATGNVLQGNKIGTNAAGTAAVSNSGNGVTILNAAGNTIGGSSAGAGNVISGNSSYGVAITGSASTGNALAGNYIGTDGTGTFAVGNALYGALIAQGAQANRVGTDGDG